MVTLPLFKRPLRQVDSAMRLPSRPMRLPVIHGSRGQSGVWPLQDVLWGTDRSIAQPLEDVSGE
jgi:hypothetical protein